MENTSTYIYWVTCVHVWDKLLCCWLLDVLGPLWCGTPENTVRCSSEDDHSMCCKMWLWDVDYLQEHGNCTPYSPVVSCHSVQNVVPLDAPEFGRVRLYDGVLTHPSVTGKELAPTLFKTLCRSASSEYLCAKCTWCRSLLPLHQPSKKPTFFYHLTDFLANW